MSAPVLVGNSAKPEADAAHPSPPAGAPALVPQPHGGALLAGGLPGNRGGPGRPKEELRARMRAMLDGAHDAMAAALAGERLAGEARAALLADPRVAGLPEGVRADVEAAIAENVTATLTTRELIQLHESLARYGVGVQQEVEKKDDAVRYVVHVPVRDGARPTGPRTVVGPQHRGPAPDAHVVRSGCRPGAVAAAPVAVVRAPAAGDD